MGSGTSKEPVTRYFSQDWDEAREKFQVAAREAGARLECIKYREDDALPWNVQDEEVMDLAILGNLIECRGLLVHTSGVHGVEGYAGSGIQIAALESLKKEYKAKNVAIIFVHGINAHGMREKRRWTAGGIDLNRNYLIGKWPDDSSNELYAKANSFLNPDQPDSIFSFYSQAIYHIVRHGYAAAKEAVAGGQSSFPGGLFYRGTAMAPALKALDSFLRKEISFGSSLPKAAIHIDIHTGLGPRGQDTLIVQTDTSDPNKTFESKVCASHLESAQRLDFVYIGKANKGTPQQDTVAYTMVGGVAESLLESLFPSSDQNAPQKAKYVQEFGTDSPLTVLRALRNEAALVRHCAQHGGSLPLPSHPIRQRLAQVFAPIDDQVWLLQVHRRGLVFFSHALSFLETYSSEA